MSQAVVNSPPGLEYIVDPAVMRATAMRVRAAAGRIAFVPTMGYLHDGHVSLLRAGRQRGELLVLSIFVNPMQFGPSEDLARYPRDLAGDMQKAAAAGCDVVFCPEPATIYPADFQTRVKVSQVEQGLCGAHRPGHFEGVATVVLKLINLVAPHVLLLGEKDYQQLLVVRRMVSDLNLDVEVVGCPLVRDSDGVALSSRNAYLTPQQRLQAQMLSRALFLVKSDYARGERRRDVLLEAAHSILSAAPGLNLEYLELRDAMTLAALPAELLQQSAVLLVAAQVGKTRLIDNIILRPA